MARQATLLLLLAAAGCCVQLAAAGRALHSANAGGGLDQLLALKNKTSGMTAGLNSGLEQLLALKANKTAALEQLLAAAAANAGKATNKTTATIKSVADVQNLLSALPIEMPKKAQGAVESFVKGIKVNGENVTNAAHLKNLTGDISKAAAAQFEPLKALLDASLASVSSHLDADKLRNLTLANKTAPASPVKVSGLLGAHSANASSKADYLAAIGELAAGVASTKKAVLNATAQSLPEVDANALLEQLLAAAASKRNMTMKQVKATAEGVQEGLSAKWEQLARLNFTSLQGGLSATLEQLPKVSVTSLPATSKNLTAEDLKALGGKLKASLSKGAGAFMGSIQSQVAQLKNSSEVQFDKDGGVKNVTQLLGKIRLPKPEAVLGAAGLDVDGLGAELQKKLEFLASNTTKQALSGAFKQSLSGEGDMVSQLTQAADGISARLGKALEARFATAPGASA